MQNIVGCTTITTNCGFVWFFLFDNWRKSFKIFADLSVAPKTLLIVIDEYDEARQKKKVCKSGSCNNLRNAIWNYFYTKNRQKQGWSECNKCTTFFYKVTSLA